MSDEALNEAISTCVGAIAAGIRKREYLQMMPAALVEQPGHLFEHCEAEHQQKLAMVFSRQIWNSCPIPANGYRPDPVPEPKRNDRCPCGSGRKYKKCCQVLRSMPLPLDGVPIWACLLTELSDKQRDEAFASKQVPIELYADIGIAWIADGEPTKAVKLLEPLFEPGREQHKVDWHLGYVLNVLCDAFDDLGHVKKKVKLLERIATNKTAISGDAWQRLVTVLIDDGDLPAAEEAFKQAMRAGPNDPNLASLEVLLMMEQGRDQDHIRNRVRFWKQRLRRMGVDDGPIMTLLDDAEEDPTGAFLNNIEHTLDPGFISLRQWINDVLQPRDIPVYGLLTVPPFDHDELDDPEMGRNDWSDLPQGLLEPGRDIQKIEHRWEQIFEMGKPFSTQIAHNSEAWLDTQWLTFLQQNEQAADSLLIIDDLVAVLDGFPQIGWIGVSEGVFGPLFERARAIMLKAVDKEGNPCTLPWVISENRPGLRLLYQRAMRNEADNTGTEKQDLEELLRINPEDNHGIRTLLINHYLRNHDDQKAIELANAYPHDIMADIRCGEILAKYRLGQLKDAEALIRKYHYERPRIAPALWRKRIRKPALDPDAVSLGGEDEAWFYRDAMREEWAATPGALEWVRKNTK